MRSQLQQSAFYLNLTLDELELFLLDFNMEKILWLLQSCFCLHL